MIDSRLLLTVYQTLRRELLARRQPEGHWVGQLSASVPATAAAASALALVGKHVADGARRDAYLQFAARAVEWLQNCQNADGGWGDTDRSPSNIAATMLACAAMQLTGKVEQFRCQFDRAQAFISGQGGLPGLRSTYGHDKTLLASILAGYALAGLAPWREVPALPLELAALPLGLRRRLRHGATDVDLPTLVAVGQAKLFHRKPWNPIAWLVRRLAIGRGLKSLETSQPPSGGFLENVSLTSFVVMSLASTGRADHPIVRRGVAFILSSARDEGAWPLVTNLALRNTALATTALAAATGDVGALGGVDWLLQSQQQEVHPLTHAAPGGWAWTDAVGAPPNVDDTSAALLALRVLMKSGGGTQRQRIEDAAQRGVDWLLNLQNADGGWPACCSGERAAPANRSGCDMTAHAIRALVAWRQVRPTIDDTVQRGFDYLASQQSADGSWLPSLSGVEGYPNDESQIYRTARVLLAYRDLSLMEFPHAQRGVQWLATHTSPGGGWGDGPCVEETALAIEALLAAPSNPATQAALDEAVQWLIGMVANGRRLEATPIGLCCAKLRYYDELQPLAFAVAALGDAVRRLPP